MVIIGPHSQLKSNGKLCDAVEPVGVRLERGLHVLLEELDHLFRRASNERARVDERVELPANVGEERRGPDAFEKTGHCLPGPISTNRCAVRNY